MSDIEKHISEIINSNTDKTAGDYLENNIRILMGSKYKNYRPYQLRARIKELLIAEKRSNENNQLQQKLDECIKALEFYGDEATWKMNIKGDGCCPMLSDTGDKARQALEKVK